MSASEPERLMDLEIKVAYLEKLVAELDGVVRDQATLIDKLTIEVERQRQSILAGSGTSPPADDKPPHY